MACCVNVDVATDVCGLVFSFSVSLRSLDESLLPRLVFHRGGKIGVNPGFKTPGLGEIRRVNRLGDSE